MENLNQELAVEVGSVATPKVETLAQMEQRAIENALKVTGGNKKQAADMLGVTIKTIYNKLHKYGMSDHFLRTKKNTDEAN